MKDKKTGDAEWMTEQVSFKQPVRSKGRQGMDGGSGQLIEVDAHSSLLFPGLFGRVAYTSQSRSMVSQNGW